MLGRRRAPNWERGLDLQAKGERSMQPATNHFGSGPIPECLQGDFGGLDQPGVDSATAIAGKRPEVMRQQPSPGPCRWINGQGCRTSAPGLTTELQIPW